MADKKSKPVRKVVSTRPRTIAARFDEMAVKIAEIRALLNYCTPDSLEHFNSMTRPRQKMHLSGCADLLKDIHEISKHPMPWEA